MNTGTPIQPDLETLLSGYVRRQAEAEAMGLGRGDGLEVTPYEAGPVQAIEPRVAWEEGCVALASFGKPATNLKAPAGWVNLVTQAEPRVAIAFCVGNYPQLVRDFHALLGQADLTSLRPTTGAALSIPSLLEWAEKSTEYPRVALAMAACRLSNQFAMAERLGLNTVPAEWRAVHANEMASLAWHQGKCDEAIDRWASQETSLPVRFNLAMARLFSGGGANVRADLEAVMAELPERSAWHHLARVYHTLSVLRG